MPFSSRGNTEPRTLAVNPPLPKSPMPYSSVSKRVPRGGDLCWDEQHYACEISYCAPWRGMTHMKLLPCQGPSRGAKEPAVTRCSHSLAAVLIYTHSLHLPVARKTLSIAIYSSSRLRTRGVSSRSLQPSRQFHCTHHVLPLPRTYHVSISYIARCLPELFYRLLANLQTEVQIPPCHRSVLCER